VKVEEQRKQAAPDEFMGRQSEVQFGAVINWLGGAMRVAQNDIKKLQLQVQHLLAEADMRPVRESAGGRDASVADAVSRGMRAAMVSHLVPLLKQVEENTQRLESGIVRVESLARARPGPRMGVECSLSEEDQSKAEQREEEETEHAGRHAGQFPASTEPGREKRGMDVQREQSGNKQHQGTSPYGARQRHQAAPLPSSSQQQQQCNAALTKRLQAALGGSTRAVTCEQPIAVAAPSSGIDKSDAASGAKQQQVISSRCDPAAVSGRRKQRSRKGGGRTSLDDDGCADVRRQMQEQEEMIITEDKDEDGKAEDPLRCMMVRHPWHAWKTGQVERMVMEKVSRKRVYCIRFSDGDLGEFTAEQVRRFALDEEAHVPATTSHLEDIY